VHELHTGLLPLAILALCVELFEFVAALLTLGYFELLDVIKVLSDCLEDLIEGYACDELYFLTFDFVGIGWK
jgi:hypothetical protein